MAGIALDAMHRLHIGKGGGKGEEPRVARTKQHSYSGYFSILHSKGHSRKDRSVNGSAESRVQTTETVPESAPESPLKHSGGDQASEVAVVSGPLQAPEQTNGVEWPEEFRCPISRNLMADPVILASGESYERIVAQVFFRRGNKCCFKTGQELEHDILTKNNSLKLAIIHWCDSQHQPRPVSPTYEEACDFVDDVCGRGFSNSGTFVGVTSSSIESGGCGSRSWDDEGFGADLSGSKEDSGEHSGKSESGGVVPSNIGVRGDAVMSLRRRHTWSSEFSERFTSSCEGVERLNCGGAGSVDNMCISKQSVDGVASPGLVPIPLAATPESFDDLGSLVGSTPETTVLDEEFKRQLISQLQHRHAKEQEEGAVRIRKLTRYNTENRLSLCVPELLTALLPLVRSRYSGVQINSVAGVMNMSLERQNKLKVVRAGYIPYLIDVLKSGHTEAQEHAAGAIFSLALDEGNRMALGVLGVIPPLINLLRSSDHAARKDATMALYHLSFATMNRSTLVKTGAVPILLGIVQDEVSDIVSRALVMLCNIAAIHEGRSALSEENAIPVLVGLLCKEATDVAANNKVNWSAVREHAAATLLQLSQQNFRFRSHALQAGALESLQRLAEEGTPRARQKATALLSILHQQGETGASLDGGGRSTYNHKRNWREDLGSEKAESAKF